MITFANRLKTGDPVDDAALDVLDAIDRGEVALTLVEHDASYATYAASNGWRFRVFDDVGSWDYIDGYAPPGESWREAVSVLPDPDDDDGVYRGTLYWRPSSEDRRRQWHWDVAAEEWQRPSL